MHEPEGGSHLPAWWNCLQRQIKTAFAFFDEIFYFISSTIELDYLIRFHFQCCENEGIQMNQLPIGLFDFESHPAGMLP